MIRAGNPEPTMDDELADRIAAGDDAAYVEAAGLLWGPTGAASMAKARARLNADPVEFVDTPDPAAPSGADADRAAGFHYPVGGAA